MSRDKQIRQWIQQADYDLETAKAMFASERYIYVVFMCHLSIEKMLKGVYLENMDEVPPKIHSLVFLVQKQNLELPEKIKQFLENLDEVSVPTRYPDELDELLKVYDKSRTEKIVN